MAILTREQLEERLASLHRASLELVQDISLESLLGRIAMVACEQVNARYAAVGVLDEKGSLEQFIPIGMTSQEIESMDNPPVGKGLIGELMHTQQPIRISDISRDPRSSGFPPNHPAMHSFLGVPIRLGEHQVGQIYLTNKVDDPEFNQDDEQVIETLAAYAAVAISNARLYKELRERDQALTHRNENLALLNNLASILASSPDIDEILETALKGVVDYKNVEVGEIFLREEDGKKLRLVLHRGNTIDSLFTRDTFLVGEGQIGMTAKSGKTRINPASYKDGHYLRKAIQQACIRQIITFPLTGRQGVLGVLCIATCQPTPFDEVEMQMMASIASWTGTAIENIRLNVQEKRLAILEERERIGMDLHDGIIQSIYAVGLTLEHARLLMAENKDQSKKRIEQAIADLNSTIRDIRTYILDLRPRQLKEEDLIQGLQRLVNELRANTQLEVNLKGSSGDIEDLPEADAEALFHICQEALANVAKHSYARRVDIFLWQTNDRVLLEIHDDGQGFDPQRKNLTLGHGISNMQTRAHNVGGDIEFTSDPGEGTTILAWVPFEKGQVAKP
jgi:two-component system, NarL family, sensor histidine kinase DevS